MANRKSATDVTTLAGASDTYAGSGAPASASDLVLVLVWSRDEPERIGELFRPPHATRERTFTIGRASSAGDDGATPLLLERLRPHERLETGPLAAPRVSRRQLRLRVEADASYKLTRSANAALLVNGRRVDSATLVAGDLVEVERRFTLLVSSRPRDWPRHARPRETFDFGAPDPDGIVGESPAAWALREQIAFMARRNDHVLVLGPSGSGKELIVNAIHRRSTRGHAKLVARNATTIPESLLDAELFGNIKNFPNPGTPERPGLIGQANRSTLFLDEIGELPHAMQAHLLRVMDHGEYQRLGEATTRRTDARIVGATNRPPSHLKHDISARFIHRVSAPGLDRRLEDVPLIARAVLRGIARSDPESGARFLVGDEPRFTAEFVQALLQRAYKTHVRELVALLWRSIRISRSTWLEPWNRRDPEAATTPPSSDSENDDSPWPSPRAEVDVRALTREQVESVLLRVDWVQERAWRELGLRNRYQLKRLIKKFQLRRA